MAEETTGDALAASSRIPLAAVALLVAIDEHGSLSAAARALGIAQPSASAGVRRLERRTGLTLVDRGARGTALTQDGLRLVPRARELLRASDAFEADVATLRSTHGARVVVAASMTIAEHLLPGWLAGVDPSTSVDVVVSNSVGVERAVLAGEAELGFVESPDVDPRLDARVVAVDELVVVVAPEHPWARRSRPVDVAMLVGSPLALREVGSGTRETLERALAQVGATLPVGPALGSTTAVTATVRRGRHAAVLSAVAVQDDLARGTLRRVLVDGVDLRRELRIVWARGRRPGAAAQAVARAVAERARAGRAAHPR